MTYTEIYQDLVKKTPDVRLEKKKGIYNIGQLCFLLASLQISENTLEQIEFEKNKDDLAILFDEYYPKAILKHGQYLAQLNRVLEHFKPKNPSPFKKYTQAVFLTAKYLSHYDSFESFRKELYLTCVDDNTTLDYIKKFRLTSNLSGMYFVKTCMFFSQSGFFDVPVPNKKAKDYLLPLLGIDDENEKLYKKMLAIAKHNQVSCHELNERIEALPC